jgi:serine protease Do
MADYCDVIRTHGNDGVISMEVLRYEEGAYYQGQFNGDPLEVISVAPAAGEAGETTEGTAYSAYEFITDDSGTIEVEVPVEWAHRDGASYVDSFGNNVWDIRASTDLQAFQDTWDVPGVTVSASVDGLANGSLTLDGLYATMTSGADEVCTRGSTTDYSDGFHTGYYELMTDCGGGAADYLVLVANADDGSYVVWVTGQAVSDADYEALDRVLGSFIASVV